MSVPDPTINFRAPQPVKDALHLLAGRKGSEPGPLVRVVLIDYLITQAALDTLRLVGLEETLRRLSQPSPSWVQPTTTLEESVEQTKQDLALQTHGPVTQGNKP